MVKSIHVHCLGCTCLFNDLFACQVVVHTTDEKHLLRPFPIWVHSRPFATFKIHSDLVVPPSATQDVVFGVFKCNTVLVFVMCCVVLEFGIMFCRIVFCCVVSYCVVWFEVVFFFSV